MINPSYLIGFTLIYIAQKSKLFNLCLFLLFLYFYFFLFSFLSIQQPLNPLLLLISMSEDSASQSYGVNSCQEERVSFITINYYYIFQIPIHTPHCAPSFLWKYSLQNLKYYIIVHNNQRCVFWCKKINFYIFSLSYAFGFPDKSNIFCRFTFLHE